MNVLEENFEQATRTIREIAELTKNEFNDQILPKYEKYVGKNIQKLVV